MTKIKFFVLMISILIMFVLESNAQFSNGLDSISYTVKSPYSTSTNKWFKKNGFETQKYDWQSLDINLELDDAKKKRVGARIWGITAISIAVLARNQNNSRGLYLTFAGVAGLIGLSKKVKAVETIKQARQLRLNNASTLYSNINSWNAANEEIFSQEVLKLAELRWLKENEFDVSNYDWENKEINIQLKDALDKKTSMKVTTGLGMLALGASLLVNAINSISQDRNNSKSSSLKNLYFIPAGFLLFSIGLNGSSKNSVKKANVLMRQKKLD